MPAGTVPDAGGAEDRSQQRSFPRAANSPGQSTNPSCPEKGRFDGTNLALAGGQE